MITIQDKSPRVHYGRSAPPDGDAGFTLVELIIVIVLIGILASVVSGPLIQGLMARQEVATDLEAIGKLRYATERIVRELRQTQFISSGTGFQLKPLQPTGTNSSSGICFTRVGGIAGTTLTTVEILLTSSSNITYDLPQSCPGTLAPTVLADDAPISLNFDYWGFFNPNTGCVNPVVSPVGGLCPIGVNDIKTFQATVNVVDVTLILTTSGGAALSQRTRVLLENGVWGSIF